MTIRELIRILWREQPIRLALVVIATVVAGMLEGLGATMLLPLLDVLGAGGSGSSGSEASMLGAVRDVLEFVGLPFSIGPVLGLTLLLVIALQIALLMQQKLIWGSVYRFEASLRKRLYGAVFHADWSFFATSKSANLLNALTVEAARAGTAYLYLVHVLAAGITVAMYAGLAAILSWRMALLVAALGGILIFLLRRRVSRGADYGLAVTRTNAILQHEALEHIAGAKFVKGTAAEGPTIERFSRSSDSLAQTKYRNGMNQTWIKVLFETASLVILLGGAYLAVDRFDISVASLVVFMFIFYRVSPRISNLQTNRHVALSNLPAVEQILDLIQGAGLHTEPVGGCVPGKLADAIRMHGVCVAYGEDEDVIRDVDMDIPSGKTVAIVGPSGAGKTTLIDVIMGLVSPHDGSVLIDGVDLSEIDLQGWRKRIGYVAQDAVFFNASISENIAWADPGVADSQIDEALRQAYADEFVDRFPEGSGTLIGDRGMRLSGGQKQRLALARALVRHPELLILDEATSALDAESEGKIQQVITSLAGSMTIVIVTHRLATVRIADMIFFVEDGRVIESGTWEELSRSGHRFAEVKAHQDLS